MFNQPPPFKQHWVYDDPSGVPERNPFPRAWPRRISIRTTRTANRPHRVRLIHREV